LSIQCVALDLKVTHLATQVIPVGAQAGQQSIADSGGPQHYPERKRQEDGGNGDHVVPQ
jgi:hypothetical protein